MAWVYACKNKNKRQLYASLVIQSAPVGTGNESSLYGNKLVCNQYQENKK